MAEGTEVHPGSFVGDSVEEWKKLPTWGKVAAVAILVVIAYLAIRSRQQTAQQAASSTAASPTAGTQSPFPMIGNAPLLPSNVNPLLDSSGQPYAYQQAPPPAPTTPPPTPVGVAGKDYGLIPFGQYHGPSYSNLKPNTYFNYNGTNYLLSTGPQGKLYGTNPSGQYLLYQPQSFYPGGSNYGHNVGAGPTNGYMTDPNIYHQASEPHITSASPYGMR